MVLRKTRSGKFVVVSKMGKQLGKPTTKQKAVKRLRQIEFFKKQGKKK